MRAARLDGDFFDEGRVRRRRVVIAGVEHVHLRDQVIADQAAQLVEMLAADGEHAVEADQRQQARRRVAHPQHVGVIERVDGPSRSIRSRARVCLVMWPMS